LPCTCLSSKWVRSSHSNSLQELLTIFNNELWLFYTAIVAFGLCIGSFLNVVVYRLPVMMQRDWRLQCHDYLELEPPELSEDTRALSLSTPASTCPKCGHKIRAWENIPVLSYLLLKGKCSSCHDAISIRYPLVEFSTGLLSLIVAIKLGVTWEMLAALIFTWTLIALTLIDLDKQLLPDNMTLPLMWLGLLLSFFNIFTDIQSSLMGAMSGYLILWSVFQVFRMVTGKEGMGFGDFKLLAALGAWMGWTLLPMIILLSSVVGSIVGITMIITGQSKRQQPIPFGPYLAIAGWIALLWGHEINQLYMSTLQ
jgi:leader peptidase (prepilin peptidase)/N-methyltransferase